MRRTLNDNNEKTRHLDDSVSPPKKGFFWMLVPIGLLVTSVTGWLVMVSIAVDDPGFAVEVDYYKKASSFDAQIAQRVVNEELAYVVTVESFVLDKDSRARLRMSVLDHERKPLTGATVRAEAFFNARAGDIRVLSFDSVVPGVYEAQIERATPGLWEVRVRIEGARTFTVNLRPELMGVVASEPDT